MRRMVENVGPGKVPEGNPVEVDLKIGDPRYDLEFNEGNNNYGPHIVRIIYN